MYNSDMPNRAELPTTKQLVRSTFIALIVAVVTLITVILPAEYAIDPTGAGKLLGLTEMGEIKTQLAQEAEADRARDQAVIVSAPVVQAESASKPSSTSQSSSANQPSSGSEQQTNPVWKDKMMLVLKPGEGAEVKLVMTEGQKATFAWSAKGGPVNFDTHGDGNGNAISYQKGRGVPNDEGELVAAFTGHHGWFFRNRNDNTVMVIIRTKGEYSAMKRML
ncbi:transmembrane anchor protein [Vibrio sp. D404a]|uniref:transmembrane anchor protein n=1 Tax=unclassified Vibrio TaxID=2614977 RepID=UPI002555FA74|nr:MULTISPECIES: transmembrane anchor protein [unclassified Vibrio]MDK9736376.1 transmembrane anchor protein [Vibrio sp. D404a]MDK9795998.1 transmembrane anchor protein [Vibrio sp. D449a]